MKKVLLAILLLWLSAFAQAQPAIPNFQFLEDEAEPQCDITFQVTPAVTGKLTLVFDYKDANNYYALDLGGNGAAKSVVLRSVLAGVEHKLASANIALGSGSVVTLQRRPWLMRVLSGKSAVLTAYDATLNAGRIGFSASGNWSYQAPRLQPVDEAVFFNDDFTRQSGQGNEWKVLSGDWQIAAVSDRITTGNQDMSANPFSYIAKAANTPALAQAGRRFWDNYDAQVSVRPTAQGTIGLAVYVQDVNNYLAFLWSSTEGSEARRLVKVENGKSILLFKTSGAYLPRQWYRIGVRTSPGFVEAFIDGQQILRVRDDSFAQGGIGLISQNTVANFDDVRVRSFPYFRQDFNGPTGGAWTPDGGFWRADSGVLNSAPKPGDGGVTRTLVAGNAAWNSYEVTASGRTGNNGACGLLVGFRDSKNFIAYRWAGAASTLPFKGRAQLLRYDNGKATILSDASAPMPDSEGYVRAAVRFAGGAVTVISKGEIVAQAADVTLNSGRPGLWAQGTSVVSFRDVVMFLPPEPESPKVAPRFEGDSLMVGWASTTGEWPPRRAGDGNLEFWNTGEFFGDATVEYIWRPALNSNGFWELSLRAKDGDFSSGTVVHVEGKDILSISLLQKGQVLKTAKIALSQINASDANPPKLRIELEGKAILVLANKTPVLSYLPESGMSTLMGTKIAARSQRFIIQSKDLRAFSANRDDYTFSEAPTDWYSPQGTWSVFHRWPCYSDWSFFGGKGLAPIILSKRQYSGDTIVEFYTHPQMNLPKELGYSHPGDLNVTLLSDGKSLTSGYSFILAGWFNTKSAILKGNTVVAQNDTAENATFDRAINHNAQFHRRWFYVRAEARHEKQDNRDGVRLRFFVDNQLLCEYFDPSPQKTFESGGRVAFWTVSGAMMLARAKIESELPKAKSLPAGLLDALNQEKSTPASADYFFSTPIHTDGLPSAVVTREDDGWKVSNPWAGGNFGVQLRREDTSTLRVTRGTQMDLDIALPQDIKIDAYVMIDGVRHLIEISGEQRLDAQVKKLGAASSSTIAGSTSGGTNWKHVSCSIGEMLHDLYPQSSNWAIQKIEIGALHGDEYRYAGLFGNPLGASYHLRNVQFVDH